MGGISELTDIRQVVADHPHHNHYVGMLVPPRPGVHLFISMLEYYNFPPGTPSNEDFLISLTVWGDILWAVTSIPSADHTVAESTARDAGVRLVSDTQLLMLGGDRGRVEFPLSGKNIYFTENISGSKAYDPNLRTSILSMEKNLVESIHAGQIPDITEFQKLMLPAQS